MTCMSVNITANCNSTQSCAWNVDDGVWRYQTCIRPTPAEPDVVCVTLNETWCESTSHADGRFFVRALRDAPRSLSMTLESTDEALDLALDVHTSACESRSTQSTCETDDEECAWRAADQRCEPSESRLRRLAERGRTPSSRCSSSSTTDKRCAMSCRFDSCVDHAECAWDQNEARASHPTSIASRGGERVRTPPPDSRRRRRRLVPMCRPSLRRSASRERRGILACWGARLSARVTAWTRRRATTSPTTASGRGAANSVAARLATAECPRIPPPPRGSPRLTCRETCGSTRRSRRARTASSVSTSTARSGRTIGASRASTL